MQISDLQKIKARGKKRVGQGHGSGRGKTAGRGTKGTKARYKVALNFEGGALPLTKRLPFLRGKGRNRSLKPDAIVLNVNALNAFTKGATVDVPSLAKQGLVALEEAQQKGVKILGDGELTVALTVKLPTSKGAAEKITKAGGTAEAK